MKDYKIARLIWKADGACGAVGGFDCPECPSHDVEDPLSCGPGGKEDRKQAARDFYKKWLQSELAAVEEDEKK